MEQKLKMNSIEKSLSILELFRPNRRSLSFSEIVKQTGFPKSSTHRILNTLTKRQFLYFDKKSKKYSIGLKLFELGNLFITEHDVVSISIPEIEKLVSETGYTVLLASIIEDFLVYLFSQHGSSPLLVQSHTGQIRKPNYGILGKLLLAYLPEEKVNSILECYPLEKTARNSIIDPQMYKRELKKIRMEGYAFARDETIDGVSGFAAPIFNRDKKVIAGIALLYPTSLVSEDDTKILKNKLLETARIISMKLGYNNY